MAATLDDVVKLLEDIKNNNDNYNNGTNRNNSSFKPSFYNNSESFDTRIKQEEMLMDQQNGRYYSAFKKEKELFELSQQTFKDKIASLEKEQEVIEDNYNKNVKRKYKDLSIKDLEEKLRRARSEKSKKDIQDTIDLLNEKLKEQLRIEKEISDIQNEITLNQMRFNRTTQGKNGFTEISKSVGNISDKLSNLYKTVTKLYEPWTKADHAASKFVKTIGGAKKAVEELRQQSLKNVRDGFGVKYNISSEELIEAQTNYIKGIGRNISMSDDAQENMAAIRAVAGDRGLEIASLYENFGVNIEDTGKHIHKMFTEASKHGLSFDKYSENVAKNIRIAQNYTFKDGLKGLENMAKKATAIKLDMQQIANFASKVSTIQGSIETAAQLQVLGGPFASMADPMGMLNESLNDMEGFSDRVSKLYSQMGHFDKATGEVRITSFDKQRLRAYAEATGQDPTSIIESVQTAVKREEILRQVNSSSNTSGLDNDMKELIANTATFKDGKAGVSIKGQFKTLDELDPVKDRELLQQISQTEGQDIKQIAQDVRSLVELREGVGKQKDGWLGTLMGWLGGFEKSILVGIGGAVAGLWAFGSLGTGILNIGGQIVNLFSGIKNPFKRTATGSANAIGNASKGFFSGAKNIGNKLTGNIFKRGTERAATRTALKLGGRQAATRIATNTAAKGAANVAASVAPSATTGIASKGLGSALLKGGIKGGGIGTVLGIGGAVGNYFTDKAVAEGKMEKGSTKHYLAKMGSGALEWGGTGMAIGSIFGPLGTAIGGAIGASLGGVIGAVQAGKAKNEVIVDNQLKALGVERKGDYNRKKLKKIDKALQTGELSNRMRRKLIQKGDVSIINEINKVKDAKKSEKEKAKKAKVKSKISIDNAIISITNGGFTDFDLSAFVGEEKVSAFDKMRDKSKLTKLNDSLSFANGVKNTTDNFFANNGLKATNNLTFKTKPETGYKASFNKNDNYNQSNNNQSIPTKITLDLNINGDLKLVGEKGQSLNMVEYFEKNKDQLREVAEMIILAASKNLHGVEIKNNRGGNFI